MQLMNHFISLIICNVLCHFSQATIQVFRLQTEIRDLSATLASAATDDASPEEGSPDPRPSTRLTSNLNLARYSTAGVAGKLCCRKVLLILTSILV